LKLPSALPAFKKTRYKGLRDRVASTLKPKNAAEYYLQSPNWPSNKKKENQNHSTKLLPQRPKTQRERVKKGVRVKDNLPSFPKIVFFYLFHLLFTILRPFGTRASIRQKADHGGQIVLSYRQHATKLVRAIVFVICMRCS
jgi:hypothetical protein